MTLSITNTLTKKVIIIFPFLVEDDYTLISQQASRIHNILHEYNTLSYRAQTFICLSEVQQ